MVEATVVAGAAVVVVLGCVDVVEVVEFGCTDVVGVDDGTLVVDPRVTSAASPTIVTAAIPMMTTIIQPVRSGVRSSDCGGSRMGPRSLMQ